MNFGKALLQPHHGIDCEARSHLSFDVGHTQMRISSGQLTRGGHPLLKRRHVGSGLQRVLRRDKPPYVMEAEALQCDLTRMHMTFMGRIERATQQTDPQSRSHRPRWLEPRRMHRHGAQALARSGLPVPFLCRFTSRASACSTCGTPSPVTPESRNTGLPLAFSSVFRLRSTRDSSIASTLFKASISVLSWSP